eukprot:7104389-Pyramimonas_sp.AAC.1
MTADGHAKGSLHRELWLQVMAGMPSFKYEAKRCTPCSGNKALPSYREAGNIRGAQARLCYFFPGLRFRFVGAAKET